MNIFRYPGGKSKRSIREKIFSRAPLFYDEYRDPFVGGGGIFFAIDKGTKRWINDIDEYLMSVYYALRDRPEEFIKACKEIEPPKKGETLTSSRPGGKKLYNARLKEVFDRLLSEENVDPALKFFFVNRTVWKGRVNYSLPSRLYYSNPKGWNIVKGDSLKQAADLLQDVKITCQSYEKLLEEPGENVFIYLDPPYIKDTDLANTSQLYRYNFTAKDHYKLFEKVQECKHKVLLSYDDDEKHIVKNLYTEEKGFFIHEENWTYSGTSSAKDQSKTKRQGKELIITNYEF